MKSLRYLHAAPTTGCTDRLESEAMSLCWSFIAASWDAIEWGFFYYEKWVFQPERKSPDLLWSSIIHIYQLYIASPNIQAKSKTKALQSSPEMAFVNNLNPSQKWISWPSKDTIKKCLIVQPPKNR